MIPVCPVRSEMMVSGRFFMGFSFAGCALPKRKPFSAVVCNGQCGWFCFRGVAGLFRSFFMGG